MQVKIKMLTRNMVIHSDDTTLQKREEVFSGIGVNKSVGIFFSTMINRIMLRKLFIKPIVNGKLVSHKVRRFFNISTNDSLEIFTGNVFNFLRANISPAFNKRKHRNLSFCTATASKFSFITFAFRSCSNIGFIGFDNTEKFRGKRLLTHSEANPVRRYKPRRAVCNVEHPVKLVSTHSFFGRAQEMKSIQPFVKRNMGVLKDSAHSDRKLFSASGTFVELQRLAARLASFFRGKSIDVLFVSAVRANRPFSPKQFSNKLFRFFGVEEVFREIWFWSFHRAFLCFNYL